VSAVALLDRGVVAAPDDTEHLIGLHETIATLLAERGAWREAYEHLRRALELACEKATHGPVIPEQLRQEVDRLRREHAEAREQAIRDALTASYNRRYLDQRLVALVEERGGGADGLAVALVDLDWFKKVNDTFGHQTGDRVLRRVVELLQDGLPDNGFCARYGGEEFVLVLPGLDSPAALGVVEAARARVESHPWHTIAAGLRVTISAGVASDRADAHPEAQLRHADGLLYAAKQSGRNVVAYHHDGEVWLAGGAAARRAVPLPNVVIP
jgi:two-component system cell cycle response regulator